MKNNNRGFTLIEIVMVLVLLGILAAVAIPKYYDLAEKADAQTAKAVAAEYQARLNAGFAGELLNSGKCDDAITAGITLANKLFTEKDDKEAHSFTAKNNPAIAATTRATTDSAKTKLEMTKNTKNYSADIVLPVCAK